MTYSTCVFNNNQTDGPHRQMDGHNNVTSKGIDDIADAEKAAVLLTMQDIRDHKEFTCS